VLFAQHWLAPDPRASRTSALVPTGVLIEECAQATEPRCCIALAKASGATVVLVADEQRLPPTCLSQEDGCDQERVVGETCALRAC